MPDNVIDLPKPRKTGSYSLEEILDQRRSQRSFSRQQLSLEQIGQLAWAAQGITGGDKRWRTSPSAGALHPLTLYVLLDETAYRYDPVEHKLVAHQAIDLAQVVAAALNQSFIAEAPCNLVFSGNITRTTRVYKQRGRDYVCIDLGHAAQNLLLQAVALELAAVPVAAFNRVQMGGLLNLPPDEEALYLVSVGAAG